MSKFVNYLEKFYDRSIEPIIKSLDGWCTDLNNELGIPLLTIDRVLNLEADGDPKLNNILKTYRVKVGFIVDERVDLYLELQIDTDAVLVILNVGEYTGPGYTIPETEISMLCMFRGGASSTVYHRNIKDIGSYLRRYVMLNDEERSWLDL